MAKKKGRWYTVQRTTTIEEKAKKTAILINAHLITSKKDNPSPTKEESSASLYALYITLLN